MAVLEDFLKSLTWPEPEQWEDYLILEQISQQRFAGLPQRFQEAYEDVLQRLQIAGLITGAGPLLLTPEGACWKQRFEKGFIED